MKIRFTAERSTARFVVYKVQPEDGSGDGAMLYMPKSDLKKFEGVKGSGYPEYLYLDIQAG